VPVQPAVHGVDAVVSPTIDANVFGMIRRAPPGDTRFASWCQKIVTFGWISVTNDSSACVSG
jgi:hypothetical protein